ncbi:MAG: TolC family protein, partial [Calditrichaeota bacterium]
AATYDLESILDLAQKNNKEIKLARSNLEFADALRTEAISQALPEINAQAAYNRNFMQNRFFFTVTDSAGIPRTESFTVSFDNDYQFNASLNQTLFGFGKIGNTIRAAGYYKTYSQLQFDAEYQNIITLIKKAFYQAILQQKVWEVTLESENSARDNYENVKIRYESGAVSEFELLQAETRWQNVIPTTTQARKNYEVALNNLKALVDIPLREEVELKGEFQTIPPLPDTLTYNEAFEKRPDYNALLWQQKFQEKRVAVEKSNHYPTLNGNLTYIYNASSNRFELENKNDNLILGVSLNIPIFSGFFTEAQVQKARIDVDRVKTQISKAHDDIRIELQNIYLRLREARQRIDAARKSIETAGRAFDIAETRVENGLATQLEFRESRVDLDRAQVTYYSAIYDYLDAYFDLERATGSVNLNDI